jgi:hypothetical protein
MYQTHQIIGVAWRGNVKPVEHIADSSQEWNVPDHLRTVVPLVDRIEQKVEVDSEVVTSFSGGCHCGDVRFEIRVCSARFCFYYCCLARYGLFVLLCRSFFSLVLAERCVVPGFSLMFAVDLMLDLAGFFVFFLLVRVCLFCSVTVWYRVTP